MSCWFLLPTKANQLYAHTHPLFSAFPSRLGHHRALSTVACASQSVHQLLFYTLVIVRSLSHVQRFVTPRTSLARQAPRPWDFSGSNTEVGCHFLLQGVFPIQGSNMRLLHWQADSLSLCHQGSPFHTQWCMYVDPSLSVPPTPPRPPWCSRICYLTLCS